MRWWAGQGRSAEAELEARPKGRRASRGRDWRAEPAGTCRERSSKGCWGPGEMGLYLFGREAIFDILGIHARRVTREIFY